MDFKSDNKKKSVIYEVNLTVSDDISEAYWSWLQQHVEDMLQINGFCGAKIAKEYVEKQGLGHKYYTVWYELENMKGFQRYIENHAEKMRSEAIALFKDKFSASRRVFVL